MKINLNFIPLNTVPKGVKSLAVYNENNKKVGVIPLGNLAPKSKGDKLYTFGALSDVHLPYNTGPEDFIRALNYFNNIEKVNFICISGDMGSTGVDSEWANFKAHVDAHSPNTPVHISAGNHDAGQSGNKSHDYPISYTGNPLYYSFTQGDDVFIMFGMTFWGNPPFSKESLQWLYETLEENRNKRCFVFQHMMRKGHAGDASGRYTFDGLDNINGRVFLSLMEHYKNVLWFHGHSHCEFEQQDTLSLPNSNYDRAFGCHSIHVPSCCMTRNEDNGYDYEDSEGYVVDVYKNGIHLRGRDFVAEKFLPIASYWIDTTPIAITAKSYTDSTGTINTEQSTPSEPSEPSDGITLPENSELVINKRFSGSSNAIVNGKKLGIFSVIVPIEDADGSSEFILKIENLPIPITKTWASSLGIDNHSLYLLNENKQDARDVIGQLPSEGIGCIIGDLPDSMVTDNGTSAEIKFVPAEDRKYAALTIRVNETGVAITEEDIKDIVITLEKSANYTNLLPLSTDVNGNDFVGVNGEDGYISGYRIKSDGTMVEQVGACATGFMPCGNIRFPIRIKNFTLYEPTGMNSTVNRIAYYDINKEFVKDEPLLLVSTGVTEESDGVMVVKPYHYTTDATYFRISTGIINENTIITVNENIPPSPIEPVNLLDTQEVFLNQRWSKSSGGATSYTGGLFLYVPIETDGNTVHTLKFKNTISDLLSHSYNTIYPLDENKNIVGDGTLNDGRNALPNFATGVLKIDDTNCQFDFTVPIETKYLAVSVVVEEGITITKDTIKDCIITLDEFKTYNDTLLNGETNLLETQEIYLNQRFKSSGLIEADDGVFTLYIPVEAETHTLKIRNVRRDMLVGEAIGYKNSIYTLDENKSNPQIVNGSSGFHSMTTGVTSLNGGREVQVEFRTDSNTKYIALSVLATSAVSITSKDIENYIITLD